ncbi:hypothetical protein EZS27_037941, partial [termite gut metagenome]
MLSSFAVVSCSDEKDTDDNIIYDETITQVANLTASATAVENEISVSWKNPNNPSLWKVEIAYKLKKSQTTSG